MSAGNGWQYKTELLELAQDLEVGETSAGLPCPACDGGRTGERKLYLNRLGDGVMYICHRASCDLGKGFIGAKCYHERGAKPKPKRKKLFDYTKLQPVALHDDTMQYLADKFHLRVEKLYGRELQWCEWLGRVLIPIKNLEDKHLGFAARYYPDLDPWQDAPFNSVKSIDFYKGDEFEGVLMPKSIHCIQDTLVLQEDYWSALRIAEYIPCVALGGTNLSPALVDALIRLGVKHLVVCLDADATYKAREIRHKYDLFFASVHVMPLKGADPKDLTNDQLMRTVIDPIRSLLGETDGEAHHSDGYSIKKEP
ncbi:hypothetical protein NVP1015O_45 [Vibrio phage 1.015.O._10N.222.51.E5]|nr:hypothetical protein NVP1015O_45 [Vibrio phage 1.015.O._10N.222.51.E5]